MSQINLGNISNLQFKVGSGDCSIYLGTTLLYSPTQPVFEGKWLAIDSLGETFSAQCDSTNEIWQYETPQDSVSVEIGSCVTSIESQAFAYYSNLTSIDIHDSVTSIGGGVFDTCTSLSSVTIGSGVRSIGLYVFKDCTSLQSITINATTPPSLGHFAFDNTPIASGTGYIYVPAASVSAYQSASGWTAYSDRITAIPNS